MPAEVQGRDGAWIKAPCLVESGADRTVLRAAMLTAVRFSPPVAEDSIGGMGGTLPTPPLRVTPVYYPDPRANSTARGLTNRRPAGRYLYHSHPGPDRSCRSGTPTSSVLQP
jgi:hypothetical protein